MHKISVGDRKGAVPAFKHSLESHTSFLVPTGEDKHARERHMCVCVSVWKIKTNMVRVKRVQVSKGCQCKELSTAENQGGRRRSKVGEDEIGMWVQ